MTTVYDEHAQHYIEFVDAWLEQEPSGLRMQLAAVEEFLGPRLDGARVLDIACGEGYASRHYARRAAEVIGIDISSALIEEAQRRADAPNLTFRVDDAHTLASIGDSSVDICVSQMALMDIPDHRAIFGAAKRVLHPGGAFVFSLLHPCFESPFREPDEPLFQKDDDGEPIAVYARRYNQEGLFDSNGAGLRGRVGSYHRMLSTYLNDLLATGFRFDGMHELLVGDGLAGRVPRVLVISATSGS